MIFQPRKKMFGHLNGHMLDFPKIYHRFIVKSGHHIEVFYDTDRDLYCAYYCPPDHGPHYIKHISRRELFADLRMIIFRDVDPEGAKAHDRITGKDELSRKMKQLLDQHAQRLFDQHPFPWPSKLREIGE